MTQSPFQRSPLCYSCTMLSDTFSCKTTTIPVYTIMEQEKLLKVLFLNKKQLPTDNNVYNINETKTYYLHVPLTKSKRTRKFVCKVRHLDQPFTLQSIIDSSDNIEFGHQEGNIIRDLFSTTIYTKKTVISFSFNLVHDNNPKYTIILQHVRSYNHKDRQKFYKKIKTFSCNVKIKNNRSKILSDISILTKKLSIHQQIGLLNNLKQNNFSICYNNFSPISLISEMPLTTEGSSSSPNSQISERLLFDISPVSSNFDYETFLNHQSNPLTDLQGNIKNIPHKRQIISNKKYFTIQNGYCDPIIDIPAKKFSVFDSPNNKQLTNECNQ